MDDNGCVIVLLLCIIGLLLIGPEAAQTAAKNMFWLGCAAAAVLGAIILLNWLES